MHYRNDRIHCLLRFGIAIEKRITPCTIPAMSKLKPCVRETLDADVKSHDNTRDVGIAINGLDLEIKATFSAFQPMFE